MFTPRLTLMTVLMAAATSAFAQSAAEELRQKIARAMPPVIGKNNSELASKLLSLQPGAPISKNFDSGKVASVVFGRKAPTRSQDCGLAKTSANEKDEGLCTLSAGRIDDPTGAFTMLAFSKNMGFGNIKYIKRAAFQTQGGNPPPSAKKTDAQAYEDALKFLESLGVPMVEIPKAPEGAKNPYPVRSLNLGAADGEGKNSLLLPAVQKVIDIPRALEVPGGLYKDPASGITLRHVVLPGSAMVVLDDSGIQAAMVKGWADVQMAKNLNPALAKSDEELIDEIVQDLESEGVRNVGTLSILIGLRNGYPNPEDPDSPNCPACVLSPSIKVIVSHVDKGPFRPSAGQPFAAPGLVREYDLINVTETQMPGR